MNRAFAAGLLALGAAGCAREPVLPAHQNVLLVVVDTLRADHLPTYGYERATAPYLDQLAHEGIVLDGYSVTSWTRPSIAALFSGLQPQRHQVIARSDSLPEEAPWLPERLTAEGFATVGFVGNPNAGRRWGFARGFANWRQHNVGDKIDGRKVTNRFLRLFEGIEPRYFGYVLYVDPHAPYEPAQAWREDGVPEWDPIQPQGLAREQVALDDTRIDQLVRQYDGEIREVDRELERLLAELRSRGLLDNTLVVITADHGEEFGERGNLSHGKTLYEESVHVPLVLWSTTLATQHRRTPRAPFSLVDLAPTILEAVGLAPTPGLDGVSRWSAIARGEELSTADLRFHLDLDDYTALGLRRGRNKLLETPTNRLLFDLDTDPLERLPLDDRRTTATLIGDIVAAHNKLSAAGLGRAADGDLDAETRAQLAALGYLDGGTTTDDLRRRSIPAELHPSRGLRR